MAIYMGFFAAEQFIIVKFFHYILSYLKLWCGLPRQLKGAT